MSAGSTNSTKALDNALHFISTTRFLSKGVSILYDFSSERHDFQRETLTTVFTIHIDCAIFTFIYLFIHRKNPSMNDAPVIRKIYYHLARYWHGFIYLNSDFALMI